MSSETQNQLDSLWRLVQRNDEALLHSLEALGILFQDLAKLSVLLHQNPQPLEVFQVFREVFDSSRSAADALQRYEPCSQQFGQVLDSAVKDLRASMRRVVSFQSHLTDKPRR